MADGGEAGAAAHGNKLGYIMGVFIPCVLGVFGVIIFLRLSWLVGQAGLILFVGIMTTAYLVAFLTVLSLGAIVTNGVMKGGGAYFSFSRTLGPGIGGSIGLVFYGANVTGCAFYLVGLTDALQAAFLPDRPPDRWLAFAIGSGILACCTLVSIVGAEFYAKTSLSIFALLLISISFGFGSLLFQPAGTADGYTGFSLDTLNGNLWPEFSSKPQGESQSLNTAFGIFFPTVTGILAGSNMSGDLADPAKAIPKGTFLAMLFTYTCYLVLAVVFAATTTREGLQSNYYLMQDLTISPYIVVFGIMCSTISSCLNNQIGGSRILQALAKDNIFPLLGFFGVGSKAKDEPRRGVMLTWFITQVLLIVAEVNLLAEVITMFFLISYVAINAACFGLSASGVPNFRPSFDMSNWASAGLGVVCCVTVMFYVSPLYALFSCLILLLLVVGVSFRTTDVAWGDLSQAVIYHQVRKFLLRLREEKEHLKYWRPQLLVLVANPHSSLQLLLFCNKLKKGGLYVIGNVLAGSREKMRERHIHEHAEWRNLISALDLKAFHQATVASSVREGAAVMLEMTGLGALRPNTVVLGFMDPENSAREAECDPKLKLKTDALLRGYKVQKKAQPAIITYEEYTGLLRDALYMGKNVLIARNFERLDSRFVLEEGGLLPSLFWHERSLSIDVWALGRVLEGPAGSAGSSPRPYAAAAAAAAEGADQQAPASLSCALLLSHVLRSTPAWHRHASIRFLSIVETDDEVAAEKAWMEATLKLFRIKAEISVFALSSETTMLAPSGLPTLDRCEAVNAVIRRESARTAAAFVPFVYPPEDARQSSDYLRALSALTADLPPVMCVQATKELIAVDM